MVCTAKNQSHKMWPNYLYTNSGEKEERHLSWNTICVIPFALKFSTWYVVSALFVRAGRNCDMILWPLHMVDSVTQ